MTFTLMKPKHVAGKELTRYRQTGNGALLQIQMSLIRLPNPPGHPSCPSYNIYIQKTHNIAPKSHSCIVRIQIFRTTRHVT